MVREKCKKRPSEALSLYFRIGEQATNQKPSREWQAKSKHVAWRRPGPNSWWEC